MQHRRFLRVTLAALALSGLTAACGSDGEPSSTDVAGAPSVCELLTAEEVSAATGKPMADGVESELNGSPVCEWESTDAPAEGLSSPIKVRVAPAERTTVYEDSIVALAADADRGRAVEGIGELAVLNCGFNDTCDEIFVVAGNSILELDLANYSWPRDFEQEDLPAIMISLATAALSRLP